MATLIDNTAGEWTANEVYEIQQIDKVEGAAAGASFGGIGVANQPHQQLANRTAFLYAQQQADKSNIATLQGQVSALLGWGFGLHGIAAFATVGTQYWAAPTFADAANYTAFVILTGGGGGGASSAGTTPGGNFASGAGGGAGATIIGTMPVTGGAQYSMSIGAGGIFQTNGGATVLYAPDGNTLANAQPGAGAVFTSSTTSAGGYVAGSSATYSPFLGFVINPGQGGDGQSGSFSGIGGQGAASFWGSGSRAYAAAGGSAPVPGAYGSGGGGSYSGTGDGGSGQSGIVMILW